DRAPRRAAARPASHLRRHSHLGCQRDRHGDDRPAGRGRHARRPDHQREHIRRRGEARGGDRRGPAGGRHRSGPRARATRGDPARTEAGGRRPQVAPPGIRNAQQQKGSLDMRRHRWLMLLALLVAALTVAGCGDDDDSSGGGSGSTDTSAQSSSQIQANDKNASTTITMGSKNFTEQKVLGEIYAQALAAAGYTVKKDLNLGDEKTQEKALENGDIDAGPEYTGTALLSLFGVPADKLPRDPAKAYEQAKADYAKKDMTAFPRTPFTNSNEVGVTQETAKKLNLKT